MDAPPGLVVRTPDAHRAADGEAALAYDGGTFLADLPVGVSGQNAVLYTDPRIGLVLR